jgi:magnesium-transporting ATPase (P-type)
MGYNYENLREKYLTLLKYPFSSRRKRMSSMIDYKWQRALLVKAASELVLEFCSCWFNQETNQVDTLTQELKNKINKVIVALAEESLRTLCLAYKHIKIECL